MNHSDNRQEICFFTATTQGMISKAKYAWCVFALPLRPCGEKRLNESKE